MNNIQEIFDAYLLTKPSGEKIRSATSMMIHLGKALDVNTQEEITSEYYEEISPALDELFSKTPQKSTLDKAILAEMIGRIGPRPKINPILKSLLLDKNENVRQYALKSLEFSGISKPKSVIPFIEQHMHSKDPDMVATAEYLTARLLCSEKNKIMLDQMNNWCENGEKEFIIEVMNRVLYLISHDESENDSLNQETVVNWIKEHCPDIKEKELNTSKPR